MTDAGGGPGEDDQPVHRYWFPKVLARFYIPLPDPLPVRDGYLYLKTQPIWPWNIERLEADGAVEVGVQWLSNIRQRMHLLLRHQNEAAASAFEQAGPLSTRISPDRPFAGMSAFHFAIRIWGNTAESIPFPSAKFAADTWRRSTALGQGNASLPGDQLAMHLIQKVDYSVAEVTVPFIATSEDQNLASDTFDYAIQVVQLFQQALYEVRRLPYRMASRELCPPGLHYAVGHVTSAESIEEFPVDEWVDQVIVLQPTLWGFDRLEELSPAEYSELDNSLFSHWKGRPFIPFLALRHEAAVALDRDGDYPACVVWAAAAAESFFDELLRHMLWEEGQLPENCAKYFATKSVAKRVRLHYARKLGGVWDLESPNAVTDWKTKVADPRNKVLHEHFRPSYEEARLAIRTIDQLVSHVGDLLAGKIRFYFRTAMQLVAIPGLRQRGVFEEFQRLDSASHQLDWSSTYTRWRHTHSLQIARRPEPILEACTLYFVFGRKRSGYWLAVDKETDLAAKVLVDESSIDPGVFTNILSCLERPDAPNPDRAFSMRMAVEPLVIKRIGRWREQYHLLPLYGVRVGGNDISDKAFTWRPRTSN